MGPRACVVLVFVLVLSALAPGAGSRADLVDARGPRLETFELPTALVDTAAPGGRLEKRRAVPKVHVLLPPGYDADPDARFPVLWLLHGANGGTDTWFPRGLGIAGITKLAPDFPGIIVMPDGGVFGMYVDWWNGGARGGPSWATYHLEELRRTIEERYRIRPGRRWHAIAGISMGGQGALRYGAMLPGYFGTVVGFSAALPDMQALGSQGGIGLLELAGQTYGVGYEDIYGPATGGYAEGNNPKALAPNYGHTRLYLTSGWGVPCLQDPIRPSGVALDALTEAVLHLQQAPFALAAEAGGAEVTTVTQCGVHTFEVWDRAIPAALEWGLFGEVEEDPDRWTYRTIATAGEMWGLRFRFAEPPASVVDFQRSGDVLAATGAGEVVLDGPGGCHLELQLPFERRLPPACR